MLFRTVKSINEGFDQDIEKTFGHEARFNFEILGLQILYQVLTFRKIKRSSIPPPVLTMISYRINLIKSYTNSIPAASENIIFLEISCVLLSVSKVLSSLINLDQFIIASSTILKNEEESIYHKPLVSLLAIILAQKIASDDQIAALKVSLGVLYMDVLSINEGSIEEDLWIGINQNPLENSNLLETMLNNPSKTVLPIYSRHSQLSPNQ